MIQYGLGEYSHWVFSDVHVDLMEEDRWKNLHLSFELEKGEIPEGLTDPSLLVVIDQGTVMEIVLQNEGCDSEYKLTDMEKEQLITLLKDKKLI
ncbi:hypothetical protein ACTWQL_01500 [Pseudalkalibacillus sp. R45]|uniref:hypothetical protein n=1 Tax=Pseudalkalibacillus sp. R45 TaxID=3457433 RepID=UPI003FCE9A48